MPSPPLSQTDPYAPEPSNTAPVLVVLVFADGRRGQLECDERAMSAKILRCGDALFLWRGDDGKRRLYVEATPLDVGG